MARKRGGLAGLWDRNKKILAPIATGIAGLINPALGAAVGGAIGGFDRPGKGGIGFDVGKGALGAASGYAMGKSLQGVKGLFAPKLGAVPGVTGAMPKVGITAGGAGSLTRDMVSSSIPSVTGAMPSVGITPGGAGALTQGLTAPALSSAAPSLTTAGGAVASKSSFLGDLFTPKGIGGVAQGVMTGIQGQQTNALERQRLAQNQRQFERTAGLAEQRFGEEQRQTKLDEERRRRVAQLMAMFAPALFKQAGIGGQPQPPAMGA
jgi:hypothetical protein